MRKKRKKTLKIVLFGAPGAGKGTQAKFLVEKLNLPHISTGDLLRDIQRKENELSRKIKSFISRGELVPDEIVFEILQKRCKERDCENGFILDGFPRTINQAKLLEKTGLSPDIVINIEVSKNEIVKRLSARRQCANCGAIYNLYFQPSQKEGICDICGGFLYQREDDKEETVIERLRVYNEKTKPLKNFYKEKNLLKEVKGNGAPERLFEEIIFSLEEFLK